MHLGWISSVLEPFLGVVLFKFLTQSTSYVDFSANKLANFMLPKLIAFWKSIY